MFEKQLEELEKLERDNLDLQKQLESLEKILNSTYNPKIEDQKEHSKPILKKFNDDELTQSATYKIHSSKCKNCGGKLKLVNKRYRDEFDIEIQLVRRRNEFRDYECKSCGEVVNITIPDYLSQENQYGSNVQALVLSLLNESCVSFKRVKELISIFSGGEMKMSEGFITKLQKRCYERLDDFDKKIQDKMLQEKVLYLDDTAINIDGKQASLKVYGTEELKYFKVDMSSDKENNVLPHMRENAVIIQDHNKVNYTSNYVFSTPECCLLLLRDLKNLNKILPSNWIQQLINLLVDTNNKRKGYIGKSIGQFDSEVTYDVIEDYDRIIDEAKKINLNDSKSRYAKEESAMIERLEEYKEYYLLWILRYDLHLSDNLDELKETKTDIIEQFESIQDAKYFARIKSYIETCKFNGINAHSALIELVKDNPYTCNEIFENDN